MSALLSILPLPLLLALATQLSRMALTPLLADLATRMRLTHQLAGVTLLALGNGAPDLCATIAAVRNQKAGMAVGELIGAAAVIWCGVVGCVALVHPFRIKARTFIRDAAFSFMTLLTVTMITLDGTITSLEGFALIALYLIYVSTVVLDPYLYRLYKLCKHHRLFNRHLISDAQGDSLDPLLSAQDEDEETADEIVGHDPHAFAETEHLLKKEPSMDAYEYLINNNTEDELQNSPPLLQTHSETALDISVVLPDELTRFTIAQLQSPTTARPIIIESFWRSFVLPITFERIVRLPFVMVIVLCIPLPVSSATVQTPLPFHFGYSERPNAKPPQPLIVFQVCATIIMLYLTASVSPWIFLSMLASPAAYWAPELVRILIGTINSCLMMNLIATELVDVIVVLGDYFGVSESVMGLSIFAIGNSIGDLAADVEVARLGMGAMAISACFGGPMMNILLGLGISGMSMSPVALGTIDLSIRFVSGGLMIFLVLAPLLLAVLKWDIGRTFGFLLIGIYLLIIGTGILVETQYKVH